ncbi:hypothetical protein KVR01_000895 [Diaporthe batatas]|uniref:uncharacterized protein n=1 Tax=Diaporthe batatas TaxID=748121 RepID=UPI001D0451F5|nr:uncharacterized protein KVR01_000895 [Diaporthe batatas]KAG8170150.1 hypothetical protein KVR01_000895 [Diaporthe batatas]
MFVSRGTGEEMGVGATGVLVDVIAQQINGSDIEAIEYPASLDDPLYFQSVSNGTTLVKEAITNYAAACPMVAAILFGDPTHREDAPYNYGNGTGSGVFWRHDISPCEALGSRIRSYCDAGDPYCDVNYDPDIYTHLKYIERYGIDVAQFVVGQYYNGGATNAPTGTGVAGSPPTSSPVTVSESGKISVMICPIMTTALLVLGLI